MLDPNLFAILQDRFFASFNAINADILVISAIVVAAVSLYGLRYLYVLDVLCAWARSRDQSRCRSCQGGAQDPVHSDGARSVSTALVGPITFFGLLVANLAYMISGSARHRIVLPVAVLLAVLCIVGGQTLLERVLAFNTALSVIIEFLGGLFLYHPSRQGERALIEISQVSKSYNGTLVVDDVTLRLPARGITSIIGPNGAGKSTLLSMVSRLLPMDKGSVTVDGLDITTTSGDVLARRLSILRQENAINSRLTVRDLVTFGRYPYSKGRP